MDLVARLHRERDLTVVLGEHRLHLAAPLASRLIAIVDGRIVADGPPREVLAAPVPTELALSLPRATSRGQSVLPPGSGHHRLDGNAGVSPTPVARRVGPPLLLFEHVSYHYPARPAAALHDVTFSLYPREVVALVGPSGAGKSTLAGLALGLLRPQTGRIEVAGLDTRSAATGAIAARAGLVLQNPLLQLLTERVEDELQLGLDHLSPSDATACVARWLRRLGLDGLEARHPLTLSEGQRRRVVLAAPLAREPQVLVLDEPTLGQDAHGRAALRDIVRAVAARRGGVLAITHDPEFAAEACDRVLALEAGRLAGQTCGRAAEPVT